MNVVCEIRPYRVVADGAGLFAILEARCGHVYSLQSDGDHHRKEARDDAAGMVDVVGRHWTSRAAAMANFHDMLDREEHYRQVLR